MRAILLALTLGLPGAALAGDPPPGAVELIVGNDLWQPGKRYRGGSDWLALTCTRSGCSFEAAGLAVRAEKWQGHYDDQPTLGQKLTLRTVKAGRGKVIAWFRLDAKREWLVAGPVTTYASSAARLKRPPSEGTLEVAVDLPDGSQASLVPLLDRAQGGFHLQLCAQGRRQMLGQLGACSGMVSTDYFLWAGDLDRDGRPDYLITFVDAEGQTILYLSSAAQPEALAGGAGVYEAPPYGGECDGGGWIVQ